jgi:tetratricopeptide (TPR) repeat protein
MRLSVCLIVRDEELRLGQALESVDGLADEVCVLDTGSRDRTCELALARGARVACFRWCEDFSAARNACLELATGDWALVLDADERLASAPAPARHALERFASGHPGCVGRLLLENLADDGVVGRVRLSRLLPLDGRHRFQGRVHEQIVRVSAGRTEEAQRRDVDLTLTHVGYALQDQARADKLARNAALLGRQLEHDPDDGYAWFQLGRTRALADDPAGALQALERALERCPDAAPWGISALEEGAYALRRLGASEQALTLLREVEPRWRSRADTCFLIALLALDTGDIERAERGFRRCLTLEGAPTGAAESNPACSTHAPAYNLGMMCEVLGRTEEARRHYRAALRFHPDHGPSRQGLRRLGGLRATA